MPKSSHSDIYIYTRSVELCRICIYVYTMLTRRRRHDSLVWHTINPMMAFTVCFLFLISPRVHALHSNALSHCNITIPKTWVFFIVAKQRIYYLHVLCIEIGDIASTSCYAFTALWLNAIHDMSIGLYNAAILLLKYNRNTRMLVGQAVLALRSPLIHPISINLIVM